MSADKKLDKKSPEAVSTAVNIFEYSETNVGVKKKTIRRIAPINPLTMFPLLFKIFAGIDFNDLSECAMFTAWYMEWLDPADNTWKATTTALNIAGAQMYGSTWIQNILFVLANKEIVNTQNLYAYKTLMEKLATFSTDAKNTHLALAGYHPDTDPDDVTDPGFIARREMWTDRKEVQFVSSVDIDPCKQEKYMLNNLEINMQVRKNDDEFLAHAPQLPNGAKVRFVLTKAELLMSFVELSDGLALSIHEMLLNGKKKAVYCMLKTEMIPVHINASVTEFHTNILTDTLAKRVCIVFVSESRFQGHFKKRFDKFEPFNIQNIQLQYNGQETPSVAYELDFTNGQCTMAYYDFMKNCGYWNSTQSNGITMARYMKDRCFFVFNTSPTLQNSASFDLQKPGTTAVYVKFRTAVPQGGVVMIVLAERDHIVKINHFRQVKMTSSV